MHQRTDLAVGQLNGSDRLLVELIQPIDSEPIIAIVWPSQPTRSDPRHFPEVAAAAMKLLAEASTTLAAMKARRLL